MSECITWMKRNRPKVRSPGAVCATIAEKQGYKKSDDDIDTLIGEAEFWLDAQEATSTPSPVYLTAQTSEDAWYKLAAQSVTDMYIHRGFPHMRTLEHGAGNIHIGVDADEHYAYDIEWAEETPYPERYMKMKELLPDDVKAVELHPVSTKSGYDRAMKALGDTQPFIRAGDTVIKVLTHQPFNMPWCPDHENPDLCPIKKSLPDVEYPVECTTADTHRCGYVKSMYYEEVTR